MKLRRFACDITAPLGTPVDPDVNMMYAGSLPIVSVLGSNVLAAAPSKAANDVSASTRTTRWPLESSPVSVAEKTNFGMHLARICATRSAGLEGSTTTYGAPIFKHATIRQYASVHFSNRMHMRSPLQTPCWWEEVRQLVGTSVQFAECYGFAIWPYQSGPIPMRLHYLQ